MNTVSGTYLLTTERNPRCQQMAPDYRERLQSPFISSKEEYCFQISLEQKKKKLDPASFRGIGP